MLLVHTQEITVDFTGFPLSLGIPPDDEVAITKTLIIDAAERDDGASPQRLNFTCSAEDMKRILREALDMLEVS